MQPNTTRQDSWINCHESTEVKSAWGKRSGEQRSWVRGSTTLECARGATSFSEVNHLKYNRVSAAKLSFRNISPLNIKKPTNLWLKIQNLEYELKAPAWTNPDLPSELTLHCSLPGPFTQPSSADRRAFAVSVSLSGTLLPGSSHGSLPHFFQGSPWCHPANEAFSGHPISMARSPNLKLLCSFLIFPFSKALITITRLYTRNTHFLILCVYWKSPPLVAWSAGTGSLVCSVYWRIPQHLEESLSQSRCSANICRISDWLNSKSHVSSLILGNNIYFRILCWEPLGYCFRSS